MFVIPFFRVRSLHHEVKLSCYTILGSSDFRDKLQYFINNSQKLRMFLLDDRESDHNFQISIKIGQMILRRDHSMQIQKPYKGCR